MFFSCLNFEKLSQGPIENSEFSENIQWSAPTKCIRLFRCMYFYCHVVKVRHERNRPSHPRTSAYMQDADTPKKQRLRGIQREGRAFQVRPPDVSSCTASCRCVLIWRFSVFRLVWGRASTPGPKHGQTWFGWMLPSLSSCFGSLFQSLVNPVYTRWNWIPQNVESEEGQWSLVIHQEQVDGD